MSAWDKAVIEALARAIRDADIQVGDRYGQARMVLTALAPHLAARDAEVWWRACAAAAKVCNVSAAELRERIEAKRGSAPGYFLECIAGHCDELSETIRKLPPPSQEPPDAA